VSIEEKPGGAGEEPASEEQPRHENGTEAGETPPATPDARRVGDSEVSPENVILIVEDDLDTADSLKLKLEGRGYNVLAIYDGLQALETARKVRPALIILDIMVPGLTGYHVCRLLKFDERYRKIPIIMLTGKVDRESREAGTKAGADLYMTKPFELSDLLEEVNRFVGAGRNA
jgi:DNA-binding response OmpR family regulator